MVHWISEAYERKSDSAHLMGITELTKQRVFLLQWVQQWGKNIPCRELPGDMQRWICPSQVWEHNCTIFFSRCGPFCDENISNQRLSEMDTQWVFSDVRLCNLKCSSFLILSNMLVPAIKHKCQKKIIKVLQKKNLWKLYCLTFCSFYILCSSKSQWRAAVLKDTGNIVYYVQTHRHKNCELILLNENYIKCFHYGN